MNRRQFLQGTSVRTITAAAAVAVLAPSAVRVGDSSAAWIDPAIAKDWRERWEKFIAEDSQRNRYCDTEMGEELGWLVSPFLNGFYYGYLATRDPHWVERLIDWTDSCVRRGVKEPDGYLGWPKSDPGGARADDFYADSMLGEAMMLRPVVLMSGVILKSPDLKARWGEKARGYVELAERTFVKWDSRGCWREVAAGGIWVDQPFGIDRSKGQWTASYAQRKAGGFSHPDNKENHIARWLIAMSDVTSKPVYRERAQKWWQLMKSRMKPRENGKYLVWNYWEPAGPWDYKSDGSPRHWVGVHPNGGYYAIDVESIVAAFEHGLVFTRADIRRLIATNRDFMWNGLFQGAKFQRLDGGPPDSRWKDSPGVLWDALVPYDETLRKIFVSTHRPDSWGGLSATPWFLTLAAKAGTL